MAKKSRYEFIFKIILIICAILFVFIFLIPGSKAHGGSESPVPAKPGPKSDQAARALLNGRRLFLGKVSFKNAGPPCFGCHNAGFIRFLGGGNLGPDLTDIYTVFGGAGLQSVLTDIEFPTMRPLFKSHPLTAEEVDDLIAFFKITAKRKPVNREAEFIYLSIAGFAIFMSLIWFNWRGKTVHVRKSLVNRFGVYPEGKSHAYPEKG